MSTSLQGGRCVRTSHATQNTPEYLPGNDGTSTHNRQQQKTKQNNQNFRLRATADVRVRFASETLNTFPIRDSALHGDSASRMPSQRELSRKGGERSTSCGAYPGRGPPFSAPFFSELRLGTLFPPNQTQNKNSGEGALLCFGVISTPPLVRRYRSMRLLLNPISGRNNRRSFE